MNGSRTTILKEETNQPNKRKKNPRDNSMNNSFTKEISADRMEEALLMFNTLQGHGEGRNFNMMVL